MEKGFDGGERPENGRRGWSEERKKYACTDKAKIEVKNRIFKVSQYMYADRFGSNGLTARMATVTYKRSAWIRRANIRFFVAKTEFDRSMTQIVNGSANAKTITFPRTVRTCRGREASYLSSRTAVLNGGLKTIGFDSLRDSKIKKITIPKCVEEI